MKTLLTILLIQIPFMVFSQTEQAVMPTDPLPGRALGIETDPVTKKYSMHDVVYFESKPAIQLFEGCYKWLDEVKYAHSLGSKGIEMDEAVFNRIRVKQYLISVYNSDNYKIRFTLTIEFRDGRIRYNYTNFVLYEGGTKTDLEEVNLNTKERSVMLRKFKDDIDAYIRTSVEELTAWLSNYQPDNSW